MSNAGAQSSLPEKYPQRLHHTVPSWVAAGSLFHIRLRLARHPQSIPLTEPVIASATIASIKRHHERGTWHCPLCVLMPDHLHALISFPPDKRMSRIIGEWKRYHATHHGILWQDNFFDHRLRNDAEVREKYLYILNNPVAKQLCTSPENWPWTWRP